MERDAQAWGLGRRLAWTLLVVPIVGGVAVAATRLDEDLYRLLTQEDGPIEWLQVVLFLGTAVAAGRAAATLWRAERIAASVFLVLAVACVFIAGEEIAWGQRLLGLETPELVREVNDQQETTIHNVGVLLYVFHVGLLTVALYGALSPFVAPGLRLPGWWHRYFVPPMALLTAFGIAAFFRIVRLTVIPHSTYTVTKWGEWTELCLAGALFTSAAVASVRARRSTAGVATG